MGIHPSTQDAKARIGVLGHPVTQQVQGQTWLLKSVSVRKQKRRERRVAVLAHRELSSKYLCDHIIGQNKQQNIYYYLKLKAGH